MDLRFFHLPLEEVLNGEGVQRQLEDVARSVQAAAEGAPGTSDLSFRTRRGKGPKGAFAQAIMFGSGALAVEYGSRNNRPYAPLRSALARKAH